MGEYQDINYDELAGTQEVKFRYREVVANDYGLSIEEVGIGQFDWTDWCLAGCPFRPSASQLFAKPTSQLLLVHCADLCLLPCLLP